MFSIVKHRSTHSAKLERWLGAENVEPISKSMHGWYGPPIAVGGAPGLVYAGKDGDFIGPIEAGGFANYVDHMARRARLAMREFARYQRWCLNGNIPDLATLRRLFRSQGREWHIHKGSVTVARFVDNYFNVGVGTDGNEGSSQGAAPGGTALDRTSIGAYPFHQPAISGLKHFFLGGETRLASATHSRATLMYDRLWTVDLTMNSTSAEAVTGVPTRYQSTTSTDDDWAGGNFLFATSRQTLAATAHNYSGVQYTDESGNTAAALPSFPGVSSSTSVAMDHGNDFSWFMPLAAGDMGIQAVTQSQLDAAVATGNLCLSIGHPIGWLPTIKGQLQHVTDGIMSAVSFTRIFDDACITFMSNQQGLNSINPVTGKFQTVQA